MHFSAITAEVNRNTLGGVAPPLLSRGLKFSVLGGAWEVNDNQVCPSLLAPFSPSYLVITRYYHCSLWKAKEILELL